ncbi:MAG TPA: M20/M25/M40 family metallo-hydrolase [Gemmatimonadaceae bacterium]|nr:M20/M25/M40 family metallo-hydrolase [Gemmatimonadaceae bacterium]
MPYILSRATIGALLVALAGCRSTGIVGPPTADPAALRRDVTYLSSDALEGRGTGTAGNDSAAAYIARRFNSLRLDELPRACNTADNTGFCEGKYLQRFVARSVVAAHAGLPAEMPTRNVVAVLRGSDQALREEYVVIGAHMDHLGRATFGALDASAGNVIRNGADDNASGTATVLELARLLARTPPKRSIIFITFSGEELGLLGSQYFVQNSPVPLDRVTAMLNFDMVGRMTGDQLMLIGVGTAAEFPEIIAAANSGNELQIRPVPQAGGGSDHMSFITRGVPAVHFFTGLHQDYHRATDDVEKVDFEGITRVIEIAERIARDIADRPAKLTRAQPAAQPVASGSSARGPRPYLGSVPDMSAVDVKGVRLSDVTSGSPADLAGLRRGDVVVQLQGAEVTDLQSYSDALYAHRPGDEVTIVVLRDGQRVTLRAKLGTRGS